MVGAGYGKALYGDFHLLKIGLGFKTYHIDYIILF